MVVVGMMMVVMVMMTATVTYRDSSITLFVPELLSLSFSLKVQFASALSELKLSYSLPYLNYPAIRGRTRNHFPGFVKNTCVFSMSLSYTCTVINLGDKLWTKCIFDVVCAHHAVLMLFQ